MRGQVRRFKLRPPHRGYNSANRPIPEDAVIRSTRRAWRSAVLALLLPLASLAAQQATTLPAGFRYTGKARVLDSEGRVERFRRKYADLA